MDLPSYTSILTFILSYIIKNRITGNVSWFVGTHVANFVKLSNCIDLKVDARKINQFIGTRKHRQQVAVLVHRQVKIVTNNIRPLCRCSSSPSKHHCTHSESIIIHQSEVLMKKKKKKTCTKKAILCWKRLMYSNAAVVVRQASDQTQSLCKMTLEMLTTWFSCFIMSVGWHNMFGIWWNRNTLTLNNFPEFLFRFAWCLKQHQESPPAEEDNYDTNKKSLWKSCWKPGDI